MLYRIGINLGDVIAEGDDIYGDGVNIAARLQASATAGGIVISNTVYDQVRNKVAVGFDFLGPLTVKNVSEAVPSYAVRIGAADDDAATTGPQAVFRREAAQARPAEAAGTNMASIARPHRRSFGVLAIIAAGLVAINAFSWDGIFWARWPLLAIAVVAALLWLRSVKGIDSGVARLGVIGLAIVAINLFSWSGVFWAVWPLLALAVVAGLKWVLRRPHSLRN